MKHTHTHTQKWVCSASKCTLIEMFIQFSYWTLELSNSFKASISLFLLLLSVSRRVCAEFNANRKRTLLLFSLSILTHSHMMWKRIFDSALIWINCICSTARGFAEISVNMSVKLSELRLVKCKDVLNEAGWVRKVNRNISKEFGDGALIIICL